MRTIHIDSSWPETNAYRFTFTLSEGEFTQEDVDAINTRNPRLRHSLKVKDPQRLRNTEGPAHFYRGTSRLKQAAIAVGYTTGSGHYGFERTAFRILKERYPTARFTTYANTIKHAFGEGVDQIRYTPRP